MEPDRESTELSPMATSKSDIEDEFKYEGTIAERQNAHCDEDSVSHGNFNNKDGTTPDSKRTSRKNSTSTQTENREGTLKARFDSAGEHATLELNCNEDGRKCISGVAIFEKAKALTRCKVPENDALMKSSEDYSLQPQSAACESSLFDPFCLSVTAEDPNDSLNTTDSDLITKQEMDDSTSNCDHGRHSDSQEETNHASVVNDSVAEYLNSDHLLHSNEDLKENSTADKVKPSLSKSQSVDSDSVKNASKGSVVATELLLHNNEDLTENSTAELVKPSLPKNQSVDSDSMKNGPKDSVSVVATEQPMASVPDAKTSEKPSRFRQRWAQKQAADLKKNVVVDNNLPLLPSVLVPSPAVKTPEMFLPMAILPISRSDAEPEKNWGARVIPGKVPKEERKVEENPVDFAASKSADSGLYRSKVSKTPPSIFGTSRASFRPETKEVFRTESKHLQNNSPAEMSLSTSARQVVSMIYAKEPEKCSPAPATGSSSSEEITDAYICYVIEKINKLKLKDFPLPGEGSINFHGLWENEWKQWKKNELPLVKPTVRQNFGTLMRFLTERVAEAEQLFNDYVCFPVPVQMDRELGRIFDVPPALITELPDDFITVLHSAISAFREEYRQRNRQILAHETQIREILMDHSIKYFQEELCFQAIVRPPCKFVELKEFKQIADNLRENVTSKFFQVCTPDFWRAKLEQRLNDRLEAAALKIKEANQVNEAAFGSLIVLVVKAIDVYENSMKYFEMDQPFVQRKGMFRDHDLAARSQALQMFQTGSGQIQGFPGQHQHCHEEVIQRLNNVANNRWASIVQEGVWVARQEEIRRKKEEADRMERERESRRQLTRTEIRNPQYSHSEQLDGKQQMRSTQQWRPKSGDYGQKPCDLQAQYAEASAVATNTSSDFTLINTYEMPCLTPLPSVGLAIHMGLYRTQVAFIIPANGQFHLVADVRNRLYRNEKENDLTPAFDEPLASDRLVFNFERDVVQSVDREYKCLLGQQKLSWDLQDVLSKFLICLKRKAELDLRMELSACVIAVPQFLHETQRVNVRQSATIAGFDHVTVVNDTTAIAVVHMVDEGAMNGNVVVVNGNEGPVDVASFTFDHGKLDCHGVTGDCFFEDNKGLLSDVKGFFESVAEFFRGHAKNSVRPYFSQKELGISPSSPNTKYLLLAKGENHELCLKAIKKATNYANDNIFPVDVNTLLYGTAYMCCLISRDPCNSILLKWYEKLRPSAKVIDNGLLDEVEQQILRPERRLKKNMSVVKGYILSSEEVQHRRTKLNNDKKADLHRDRLALLKLINTMEKSQVSSDNQLSESIQQHLVSYSKELFQQDLHPDKLKNIKEGIMALRVSSDESSGSFV